MAGRPRKSNGGRPNGTKSRREMIASFRGSEAFESWFKGLISHRRERSMWPDLPASSVIERVLACLAREQAHETSVPIRR